MDSKTLPPPVFLVLLGMVIVWFVLIKLLFNRLEVAHPEKYEAMGRPSLFLRNNVASGWETFKFLVMREHRTLNDRYLSRLSDAMLVFFTIYLLMFLGIFYFLAAAQPA